MKKLLGLFIVVVTSFQGSSAWASYRSEGSYELAAGVAAFQENRLHDAMKSFLTVLQEDPENRRAHAYVELITQKIRSEQERFTDERRLDLLRAAAFQLEPKDTKQLLLREEIQLSSTAQSKKESKRWRNLVEESTVQRGLGHLFNAYDLTLRVLAQNPAFPEAQQELSEIQMAASQRLTLESGLSVSERFVLQGFYAYSEANYAEALKAWEKAESILAQTYPSSEQTQYVNRFRFASYSDNAKSILSGEKLAADLKTQFEHAQLLFRNGQHENALRAFRAIALENPEYPQLGFYLTQAESMAEKDRIKRIGEEKLAQIKQLYEQGLALLQESNYLEAEKRFERVLELDATHLQAKSYLGLAQAEIQRRYDPKIAQSHYESGLIAYASGKLDEAQREWKVAIRMNPNHQKARRALEKVQHELLYAQQNS